jgi:hypothetical protein
VGDGRYPNYPSPGGRAYVDGNFRDYSTYCGLDETYQRLDAPFHDRLVSVIVFVPHPIALKHPVDRRTAFPGPARTRLALLASHCVNPPHCSPFAEPLVE